MHAHKANAAAMLANIGSLELMHDACKFRAHRINANAAGNGPALCHYSGWNFVDRSISMIAYNNE